MNPETNFSTVLTSTGILLIIPMMVLLLAAGVALFAISSYHAAATRTRDDRRRRRRSFARASSSSPSSESDDDDIEMRGIAKATSCRRRRCHIPAITSECSNERQSFWCLSSSSRVKVVDRARRRHRCLDEVSHQSIRTELEVGHDIQMRRARQHVKGRYHTVVPSTRSAARLEMAAAH